ncbi:hypothetical protein [Terasakiella pusilla]|uniref:hypothetical protein n=1 Tax=Terasakiella pusilla TaxID=64973 RepID=UPI003AA904A6
MFTSRFKVRLLLGGIFFIIFLLPVFQKTQFPLYGPSSPLSEITDLSLGNSHTQALNFESIGLKGLRLFYDGGGPFEAAFYFDQYVSHLPNLKRVWLPLTVFYPHIKVSENFSSWSFKLYNMSGSDVLKKMVFFETAWRQKVKGWLTIKEKIRQKLGLASSLKNHIFVDGVSLPCSIMKHDEIARGVEKSVVQQTSLLDKDNLRGYDLLEGIVVEAARRGIEVVFYMPPFTREYFTSPYLDDFRAQFRVQLAELSAKHVNLTYLDFHDLFYDNYRNFFYDNNHLNCFGAAAFSKVIYEAFIESQKKIISMIDKT